MLGAIAITVVVLNNGDPPPPAQTPKQAHVAAPPASAPTPTYDTPTPTTETPGPHTLLDQQVDADRATVESLTGSWVPQLSAKKPGLIVDGTTYDYAAIWRDFQEIKSRYPDAVLLWSGDYSTFRSPDFWVTVAPVTFTDGPAANGWCDAQGIGADDCFAKLISHSHDPAGATLPRPR